MTSRAAIATSAGKPWILEEFGMDVRTLFCHAHLSWHLASPCLQMPRAVLAPGLSMVLVNDVVYSFYQVLAWAHCGTQC